MEWLCAYSMACTACTDIYVRFRPEWYTATCLIGAEHPHRGRAPETTVNTTTTTTTSNKLPLLSLSCCCCWWWWAWRCLLLSCCSLLDGVVVLLLLLVRFFWCLVPCNGTHRMDEQSLFPQPCFTNELPGVPYNIVEGGRRACLQLVGRRLCCWACLCRLGGCTESLLGSLDGAG